MRYKMTEVSVTFEEEPMVLQLPRIEEKQTK